MSIRKPWLLLLSAAPLLLYANDTDSDHEDDCCEEQRAVCRPRPRSTKTQSCCPPKQVCCEPVEPSCCEPLAVPRPLDQCDEDKPTAIGIGAEYLFWSASQDGLGVAVDGINNVVGGASTTRGKVYQVPQKWNSGVRVEASLAPSSTTWDLSAAWTWYQTTCKKNVSSRDTTPPENPDALQPIWGYPQREIEFLSTADAKWRMRYNTLDLCLNRTIAVSNDFTLTPFAGLRGAWIKQSFNVTSTNSVFPDTQQVNNTNNFKAIGLLMGLNSAYYLTCDLSFFAKGAATIFIGQFNVDQSLVINSSIEPLNTQNKFTSLKGEFEAMLGFRWETAFSNGCYLFEAHAGYEALLWLDQNQMFRFVNGIPGENGAQIPGSFVAVGGDLFLQGLTVGGSFKF
jgi:hypothetical protein